MALSVCTCAVVLLAIGPFVNGSPNSRGPDDEIEARSLSEVFKVKKIVGDTFHKVYNMVNNFVWCGKPSCPDYPKEMDVMVPLVPEVQDATPDSGKEPGTPGKPDEKPSVKPSDKPEDLNPDDLKPKPSQEKTEKPEQDPADRPPAPETP